MKGMNIMITPAYESFINDISKEYTIANENAITDAVKQVWDTIKSLWSKFVKLVTGLFNKIIALFKRTPKEASADDIAKVNGDTEKKESASTKEVPSMTDNQKKVSEKYSNASKEDTDQAQKETKVKEASKEKKYIILSEDAAYWVTCAADYCATEFEIFRNIVDYAKKGGKMENDSENIARLEKYTSCEIDLHKLEDDYIDGKAGTSTSMKIGYMEYDKYLRASKATINNLGRRIDRTNKLIQGIDTIGDKEYANKILDLSRKLINYTQAILNKVNTASQSGRITNLTPENAAGKCFNI